MEYIHIKPDRKMYYEGRLIVSLKCEATEEDLKLRRDQLKDRRKDTSKSVYSTDGLGNVKFYKSISDASMKTKINKSGISKCCNKEQQMAGGLKWSFTNTPKIGGK